MTEPLIPEVIDAITSTEHLPGRLQAHADYAVAPAGDTTRDAQMRNDLLAAADEIVRLRSRLALLTKAARKNDDTPHSRSKGTGGTSGTSLD